MELSSPAVAADGWLCPFRKREPSENSIRFAVTILIVRFENLPALEVRVWVATYDLRPRKRLLRFPAVH
jgi:hypothetical protein